METREDLDSINYANTTNNTLFNDLTYDDVAVYSKVNNEMVGQEITRRAKTLGSIAPFTSPSRSPDF